MNPAISKPSDTVMTPEEKRSLEILLGDEDPNTFEAIERFILRDAEKYVTWLHACRLSDNAVVRKHATALMTKHLSMASKVRFLIFCHTQPENLDLELGLLALARTEYPEINVDGYRALLDFFADNIRGKIMDSLSPYDILEHINHYLFETEGFSGNQFDYYSAENNYLNKVIDNRCGNPVGLSCIYWLIGKRLNLPLTGIGMPGHFLIRFQNEREEIYVDPFNNGRILSRKDCIRMATALGLEFHNSLLSPTTSRATLIRICTNLATAYRRSDNREKSARIDLFINYLNRRIQASEPVDR